jgi:hypothetical protein
MRLAVVAVSVTSLSCALSAALAQQPRVEANSLTLTVHAEPGTPEVRDRIPEITASFSYTPQSHQELVVRQLVRQMELRDELQRSVDLKTSNESPLSTVLNLSRFLTSRGYKRADGSPLIDLSF